MWLGSWQRHCHVPWQCLLTRTCVCILVRIARSHVLSLICMLSCADIGVVYNHISRCADHLNIAAGGNVLVRFDTMGWIGVVIASALMPATLLSVRFDCLSIAVEAC
jgi:hypothetical protein